MDLAPTSGASTLTFSRNVSKGSWEYRYVDVEFGVVERDNLSGDGSLSEVFDMPIAS